MSGGGSFIERVAAMRSLAADLVAEADAILAAVDRTWAPADESCVHPPARRVSVASMGAPERWLCGACGVEGTGGGT